jgi:HSP20 family molecular chaperone IbpA
VPATVEANKAEASFKKHVLTVKLPKIRADQERGTKIEIKSN